MTTAPCGPAPVIPLQRPWWQRWRDAWPARRPTDDALYRELRHLDEHTLRDIGAPDWLHERDRSAERWLLDARQR